MGPSFKSCPYRVCASILHLDAPHLWVTCDDDDDDDDDDDHDPHLWVTCDDDDDGPRITWSVTCLHRGNNGKSTRQPLGCFFYILFLTPNATVCPSSR